jgi:hypothetical protein
MNFGRQVVFFAVGFGLLFGVGCEKKHPHLPPQAKAPAEPIPSPLPPEISEETPPPPAPSQPKQEETAAEQPKPKPAPHRRKKPTQPTVSAQNNAAVAPSNASDNTTAMAAAHPPSNPANEAPPDIAIAADVSSAQLSQQKRTTMQLLQEAEKAISGLNRQLSGEEKGMVTQIQSYIAQSRDATKEGDFERAYNLATKAHLLSDALAKK